MMPPILRALPLFALFCFVSGPAWSENSGEEGTGYTAVTEEQRRDYFRELSGDRTTCDSGQVQSPVQSPVNVISPAADEPPPQTLRYDEYVYLGNGVPKRVQAPMKNTAHGVEVGPVQDVIQTDIYWWSAVLSYALTPKRIVAPGQPDTNRCGPPRYWRDPVCSAWTGTKSDVPLHGFHFHHPSEHLLDGRRYAMEMHLVFANTYANNGSLDGIRRIAVFGVFLDIVPDAQVDAGSPLRSIFRTIADASTGTGSIGEFTIPGRYERSAAVLNNLVPADKRYVRYAGSLTTPDCRESVTWFVFKTPLKVTQNEVTAFKRLHQVNARPVQKLNGRTFTSSVFLDTLADKPTDDD